MWRAGTSIIERRCVVVLLPAVLPRRVLLSDDDAIDEMEDLRGNSTGEVLFSRIFDGVPDNKDRLRSALSLDVVVVEEPLETERSEELRRARGCTCSVPALVPVVTLVPSEGEVPCAVVDENLLVDG